MSAPASSSLEAYVGLDAASGAPIAGEDHLRQSIRDIITTPIGSRVMRRTYGSCVPFLIDAPMTPGLVAEIVASVAEALDAWEPRIVLKRVVVRALEAGRFTLDLFAADLTLLGVL